jgi:hypothetical protein
VALGRDGIVGKANAGGGAAGARVSNRWRAAKLTWVLESDNVMTKDTRK